MRLPDDTPAQECPACGSTNIRRRIFGMPTGETFEQVERDPDLELGGCILSPDLWEIKCRDCEHEVPLSESGPSLW